MRRAERAAGFTLIEVIVVLAVLGLVGGLVLVRGPQRSAAMDLRQAAAIVTGALRVARSRAIATNQPVPVRFDAGTATLQVGQERARALPPGIGVAVSGGLASAPVVLFRPDGSSSGGVVELSGRNRSARVGVSWLTGRVATAETP